MDTYEFATRKEDLLEQISDGIFQVKEAMFLLKLHERKAVEPDEKFLEELEQLLDHAGDIEEWFSAEWDAAHPLAEAARYCRRQAVAK